MSRWLDLQVVIIIFGGKSGILVARLLTSHMVGMPNSVWITMQREIWFVYVCVLFWVVGSRIVFG